MLIEVNQRLDFSSISVFFGFKNKAIYKKMCPFLKLNVQNQTLMSLKLSLAKKIKNFIRKIKIIYFKPGTKFAQRFAELLIHNNLCFYAVKFLD